MTSRSGHIIDRKPPEGQPSRDTRAAVKHRPPRNLAPVTPASSGTPCGDDIADSNSRNSHLGADCDPSRQMTGQ